MKPQRNQRYLAWIRTQPCCVCGSKKGIEASHTGPHGIGQKSPDTSAIPLCPKHHRTGNDSYHRLGPRKFSEKHSLDIPALVRRFNLKPKIRVWFTSAESFARVLSDRNRALLGIIAESVPESLARLAEMTGRQKSNLSRTLKTMERYGFVRLSRGLRGSLIPRVPYQRISLTLPLSKTGHGGTKAA